MPLLRAVADVREALGFSDQDSVNDHLIQALKVATATLASRLRCDFARATVVDEFFVRRSLRPTAWATETILKLGQGMVDSAVTYNVYAASTPANANFSGTPTKRTNLRNITPSASPADDRTRLDFNRGLLYVNNFGLSSCYVRVEYTCGLTNDGGDPQVYESVPDWLQAAVLLEMMKYMDTNNNFPRVSRRQEEDRQDTENIEIQLGDLISGHVRYAPMAIKPDISTVTLV